jgi:hypothetical protein
MSDIKSAGRKQRSLGTNFVPGDFTVICGRGKIYASSSGNVHLKRSVQQHAVPYARAKSRIEKSDIVSSIISAVQTASPEAALVRFEADQWWEVDESFAREKVGGMFRDLLHTKYRSSSKAKLARNKHRGTMHERAAGLQQEEQEEEGKEENDEGRGDRNTNSLLLGGEEGRGGLHNALSSPWVVGGHQPHLLLFLFLRHHRLVWCCRRPLLKLRRQASPALRLPRTPPPQGLYSASSTKQAHVLALFYQLT